MASPSSVQNSVDARGSTSRRRWLASVGSAVAVLATLGATLGARPAGPATPTSLPRSTSNATSAAHDEIAVLSGGCFWGMQMVFEHVIGVTGVTAGYAGGDAGTATYEEVSSGATGHAESVRISFDSTKVSYADILKVFFTVHDPTELNRQGPDDGTQYRSAIWYLSPDQRRIADAVIQQLTVSKAFPKPIVTQVNLFKGFFAAEAYHQDYGIHNPYSPYILINDRPKVETLKKTLPSLYRDAPVLYAAQVTGQ
jgi:peptide-methionine (S)-S-oxide reductase